VPIWQIQTKEVALREQQMKKLFGILFVLMLAVLMIVPASVFAADPTVINMNWSGGGNISGTVTAGNDAIYSLSVGASTSAGQFNVRDENNNPYGYNVDSTSGNVNLTLSGGSALSTVQRTDSYVPMYGAAGQHTSSFIAVNPDGTAGMGMCTSTNFAAAQEANYGNPLGWVSGYQFTANSPSLFQITHQVWDSDGDTAYVNSFGSGSAAIKSMSSDLGAGSLTFGKGAGCYTAADFTGNGSQTLEFGSSGHSAINQFGFAVPGNGTAGSAQLFTQIMFNGAFSTPNPSTGPGFSADVN
jgi:hypothetical protein